MSPGKLGFASSWIRFLCLSRCVLSVFGYYYGTLPISLQSCSSDNDCKYSGCDGGTIVGYCRADNQDSGGTIACVYRQSKYTATTLFYNTCPPGPCVAGKFKTEVLNSGVLYHYCNTCGTSCPAGNGLTQACTASANILCSMCAIGSFSTGGTASCSLCSPGWYAGTTGMTGCTQCGIGYYAADYGMSACQGCTSPYTTQSLGQTSCNACLANYWWNSAGNTCAYCGAVGSTKNCPVDNYAICTNYATKVTCSVCTGHQSPFCAAGQEPDRVCDGGGLVNSVCVNCPASKEKKISTAWCTGCETGYFKSSAGTGNCQPCTKAPVGGVYTAWLTVDRSTDSCPW